LGGDSGDGLVDVSSSAAPPDPGPGSVTGPDPVATGDTVTGDMEDVPAQPVIQVVRYLYLKNQTGGKLTVYLQYRTQTDQGAWQWFPADPAQSTEILTYELEPDQETYLQDNEWTINASWIRIWAVSETGEHWSEYKDKDLWLVPEVDQAGHHYYLAPAIETYSHTFGR
jgi:hypothetical protein